MARLIHLLLFILILAVPVQAQLYQTQYRAPGQDWMELRSDRFRVIYPDRYQAEAIHSMKILESEYEDIQNLVGGSLRNFPFIINPDNDRSNGFVSPINFRSEIELAPIIGKTMNPRSGDWLEVVLPHELVHALHFSVNPSSLTSALGVFSPDVRRSVHSAAPLGVFEGIAVQHESHGTIPGSGRGNYPFFRNQFNTLLDTREQWSMGQLLHTSDFTPPFDRHYIGGYELTHWLLERYGEKIIKEAIDYHYRYPFLGFGMALRKKTGEWPAKLYRNFIESRKAEEDKRRSEIVENGSYMPEEVSFDANYSRMSRPLWMDNETILFYARSSNRPTGFYLYDTQNGSTEKYFEVVLSPDVDYSLSEDKETLYYSRLHTDPIYDNLYQGDIHKLDTESGRPERITHGARLFAPEYRNGELYAAQVEANELNLVKMDPETGEILKRYSRAESSSVIQIAMNPHREGYAAVVGRKKSVQAIWLVDHIHDAGKLFDRGPDLVFEEGSIMDVSWHPGGEKFLFASDHTGVMNIYEYDLSSDRVVQITESVHNAFEGSYSPDGSQIAYIGQVGYERKLHLLEAGNWAERPVHKRDWSHNEKIDTMFERPLMNRSEEVFLDQGEWEFERYRTGISWVRPRLWNPTYERESDRNRFGLHMESVDVMNSQRYEGDVNFFADRVWYNAKYINNLFFPGFRIELFNNPVFTTFKGQLNGEEVNLEYLQQSRGTSLRIPVRFRLESNARFSSILFEPQYFLSQIRFLDAEQTSRDLSDFGTRHTIGLRSVLNLKLRQFSRDMQPNSGLVLFGEGRYGLNSDQFQIQDDNVTITGDLVQRKGIRAGMITYLAPLSKWNQSMRVMFQVYSQTDVPVFNLSSQYSDLFSETPLSGVNTAGMLNTRYTIPLIYPDEGGLLLPAYLSNIYLVLFSQTVTDLDEENLLESSRSVFGLGIRSRFRISNMAFDFGVSIGWEPTRNEFTGTFGTF